MNLRYLEPIDNDYPQKVDTILPGVYGYGCCCAFNRRGTLLAVGCVNGRINIWDFETKSIATSLEVHNSLVTSISWSHNGRRLLSSDQKGLLCLWDVLQGSIIMKIQFESGIVHSWINTHSPKYAMLSLEGREPLILTITPKHGTSACISYQNSSQMGSMTTDEKEWLESTTANAVIEGNFDIRIRLLRFRDFIDPNNPKYKTLTKNKRKRNATKEEILCAVFDTYATTIYCGTSFGRLMIIDHHLWKMTFDKNMTNSAIKSIVSSGCGRYLLTNSRDRVLRCLSLHPKGGVKVDRTYQDSIEKKSWISCCFSSDSEYVCASTAHKHCCKISIWRRCFDGVLEHVLHGPDSNALDILWHPTQSYMVTVLTSGDTYIWREPRDDKWCGFAPDFKELESNVWYRESDEDRLPFDPIAFEKKVAEQKRKKDEMKRKQKVEIWSKDPLLQHYFADHEEKPDGFIDKLDALQYEVTHLPVVLTPDPVATTFIKRQLSAPLTPRVSKSIPPTTTPKPVVAQSSPSSMTSSAASSPSSSVSSTPTSMRIPLKPTVTSQPKTIPTRTVANQPTSTHTKPTPAVKPKPVQTTIPAVTPTHTKPISTAQTKTKSPIPVSTSHPKPQRPQKPTKSSKKANSSSSSLKSLASRSTAPSDNTSTLAKSTTIQRKRKSRTPGMEQAPPKKRPRLRQDNASTTSISSAPIPNKSQRVPTTIAPQRTMKHAPVQTTQNRTQTLIQPKSQPTKAQRAQNYVILPNNGPQRPKPANKSQEPTIVTTDHQSQQSQQSRPSQNVFQTPPSHPKLIQISPPTEQQQQQRYASPPQPPQQVTLSLPQLQSSSSPPQQQIILQLPQDSHQQTTPQLSQVSPQQQPTYAQQPMIGQQQQPIVVQLSTQIPSHNHSHQPSQSNTPPQAVAVVSPTTQPPQSYTLTNLQSTPQMPPLQKPIQQQRQQQPHPLPQPVGLQTPRSHQFENIQHSPPLLFTPKNSGSASVASGVHSVSATSIPTGVHASAPASVVSSIHSIADNASTGDASLKGGVGHLSTPVAVALSSPTASNGIMSNLVPSQPGMLTPPTGIPPHHPPQFRKVVQPQQVPVQPPTAQPIVQNNPQPNGNAANPRSGSVSVEAGRSRTPFPPASFVPGSLKPQAGMLRPTPGSNGSNARRRTGNTPPAATSIGPTSDVTIIPTDVRISEDKSVVMPPTPIKHTQPTLAAQQTTQIRLQPQQSQRTQPIQMAQAQMQQSYQQSIAQQPQSQQQMPAYVVATANIDSNGNLSFIQPNQFQNSMATAIPSNFVSNFAPNQAMSTNLASLMSTAATIPCENSNTTNQNLFQSQGATAQYMIRNGSQLIPIQMLATNATDSSPTFYLMDAKNGNLCMPTMATANPQSQTQPQMSIVPQQQPMMTQQPQPQQSTQPQILSITNANAAAPITTTSGMDVTSLLYNNNAHQMTPLVGNPTTNGFLPTNISYGQPATTAPTAAPTAVLSGTICGSAMTSATPTYISYPASTNGDTNFQQTAIISTPVSTPVPASAASVSVPASAVSGGAMSSSSSTSSCITAPPPPVRVPVGGSVGGSAPTAVPPQRARLGGQHQSQHQGQHQPTHTRPPHSQQPQQQRQHVHHSAVPVSSPTSSASTSATSNPQQSSAVYTSARHASNRFYTGPHNHATNFIPNASSYVGPKHSHTHSHPHPQQQQQQSSNHSRNVIAPQKRKLDHTSSYQHLPSSKKQKLNGMTGQSSMMTGNNGKMNGGATNNMIGKNHRTTMARNRHRTNNSNLTNGNVRKRPISVSKLPTKGHSNNTANGGNATTSVV